MLRSRPVTSRRPNQVAFSDMNAHALIVRAHEAARAPWGDRAQIIHRIVERFRDEPHDGMRA